MSVGRGVPRASRYLVLSMLKMFAQLFLREGDVGPKVQLNSHRTGLQRGLLGH